MSRKSCYSSGLVKHDSLVCSTRDIQTRVMQIPKAEVCEFCKKIGHDILKCASKKRWDATRMELTIQKESVRVSEEQQQKVPSEMVSPREDKAIHLGIAKEKQEALLPENINLVERGFSGSYFLKNNCEVRGGNNNRVLSCREVNEKGIKVPRAHQEGGDVRRNKGVKSSEKVRKAEADGVRSSKKGINRERVWSNKKTVTTTRCNGYQCPAVPYVKAENLLTTCATTKKSEKFNCKVKWLTNPRDIHRVMYDLHGDLLREQTSIWKVYKKIRTKFKWGGMFRDIAKLIVSIKFRKDQGTNKLRSQMPMLFKNANGQVEKLLDDHCRNSPPINIGTCGQISE